MGIEDDAAVRAGLASLAAHFGPEADPAKTAVLGPKPRTLRWPLTEITLSPINSGATKPIAHPRGRSTFLPLREYPFRERRASRSLQSAVVELAVTPAVPGIADMVVRVARMRCDQVLEVVWKP